MRRPLIHPELEKEAALGSYMLEVRHNVNNALTSILGNCELALLEPESLTPTLRAQFETIRNMGLRLNEIMQRFSSLQKEMELIHQQSNEKEHRKTRRAAAGKLA